MLEFLQADEAVSRCLSASQRHRLKRGKDERGDFDVARTGRAYSEAKADQVSPNIQPAECFVSGCQSKPREGCSWSVRRVGFLCECEALHSRAVRGEARSDHRIAQADCNVRSAGQRRTALDSLASIGAYSFRHLS